MARYHPRAGQNENADALRPRFSRCGVGPGRAPQMNFLRMRWLTMSSSETVITTMIRIAEACE